MTSENERLLRSFSRDLRARNRSERTIQSYEEAARFLACDEGIGDLRDTTREQIQNYIATQTKIISPSTAALRFRSLQQVFAWMEREEIIERSPMAKMKAPNVPEVPVDIIPDDELAKLLRTCSGKDFTSRRDTAIIRLLLDTGIRVSELVALELDTLDMQRDVIVVIGKGGKVRAVPFGAKTGQALDRYLRARSSHPAARTTTKLWLGSRQKPLTASGVTQMLERRPIEAGVEHVHAHRFRHTAAHAWLASGGAEQDAMRIFGWDSREMLVDRV